MIYLYVDDLFVTDTETLNEQSLEGARMGYTGKQVIHPIQVPIVQDAFSPSPKKVEWATELIKAFEEHQQSGKASDSLRNEINKKLSCGREAAQCFMSLNIDTVGKRDKIIVCVITF